MPLSIKEYLKRGPSTSKEIQAATGLSQSSVARRLRALGDNIVQIQDGRSIRYAATCNAFGVNDKIPLGLVNHTGKINVVAYLRPLSYGGYFLQPATSISPLLLGESGNGLYDGLPYFLYDLRPQGFIGRQISRKLATRLEAFPADPRQWTNTHIGKYLISNGDDLPGNFILGEQSILRLDRRPYGITGKLYPKVAEDVLKGEVPGSSAGGEQPKFTAFNSLYDSHVIVKFSPKDDTDIAKRWRDILITEYHAAQVINDNICPAAQTIFLKAEGRLFLETQRFDRLGVSGRYPMISLQAIDDEFTGLGHNWARVMTALKDQGLVSDQDAHVAEQLMYFGQLIHNTDMHLGNLSLFIDGEIFRLLPCYDMCSMGFAPQSAGEVGPFFFDALAILDPKLNKNDIVRLRRLAYVFWENVLKDEHISSEFRAFLSKGNPVASLLVD
ncbi:MAG TPA: type II toxin-antitoxin system HipA family toxinoxin YjjJ [Desulfobacteraceae bacterium]|nr:type II toxin-antitoxin system HipA family toxinoxin YjjJ [Desulfobacteraceae bacterium]